MTRRDRQDREKGKIKQERPMATVGRVLGGVLRSIWVACQSLLQENENEFAQCSFARCPVDENSASSTPSPSSLIVKSPFARSTSMTIDCARASKAFLNSPSITCSYETISLADEISERTFSGRRAIRCDFAAMLQSRGRGRRSTERRHGAGRPCRRRQEEEVWEASSSKLLHGTGTIVEAEFGDGETS